MRIFALLSHSSRQIRWHWMHMDFLYLSRALLMRVRDHRDLRVIWCRRKAPFVRANGFRSLAEFLKQVSQSLRNISTALYLRSFCSSLKYFVHRFLLTPLTSVAWVNVMVETLLRISIHVASSRTCATMRSNGQPTFPAEFTTIGPSWKFHILQVLNFDSDFRHPNAMREVRHDFVQKVLQGSKTWPPQYMWFFGRI